MVKYIVVYGNPIIERKCTSASEAVEAVKNETSYTIYEHLKYANTDRLWISKEDGKEPVFEEGYKIPSIFYSLARGKKSEVIRMRITPELKHLIATRAEQEGLNGSQLMEKAILEYLK